MRGHTIRRAWLGALLLMGAVASSSAAGTALDLVGEWPYGPVLSVAVAEPYAYFASGPVFLVADFTDPAAISIVSETIFPEQILLIAVTGHYACVVEQGGFRVIDILDPLAPRTVGYLEMPPLWALDMVVSGDSVFIGDSHKIFAIDISDPSAPVRGGSYRDPCGAIVSMAPYGDYLFVTSFNPWGGFCSHTLVDISNPTKPLLVSILDWAGRGGQSIVNSFYYLADWYRLSSHEISDPLHPVPLDVLDIRVGQVAATASKAIGVDRSVGLRVVDVSDPAQLSELGSFEVDRWNWKSYELEINGDLVFLADNDRGLRVVDVAAPATPTEIWSFNAPGISRDVEVAGGYAYVASGERGLRVLDITDPAAPVEVGSTESFDRFRNISISGTKIYVVDRWGGLRIVDVADPTSPEEIGVYDPDNLYLHIDDLIVSGSYVLLVDGRDLLIIDVTDPTNPTRIATLSVTGGIQYFALSGDAVYLLDSAQWLTVVDFSNPHAPAVVSTTHVPGLDLEWVACARAVPVAADLLVIYSDIYSREGLHFLDISDSSNPTVAGYFATSEPASGVAITNPFAWIANGDGGLRVIDFSNPGAPVERASFDTGGQALGVTVADGLAYIADGSHGLTIVSTTTLTDIFSDGFESGGAASWSLVVD